MNAIVGNRGSGKTTELVAWFNESPETRIILTGTHFTKTYIERSHHVPASRVIVAGAGRALRGLPVETEFGFDNIEGLILDALGVLPDVVTFTGAARTPSGIPEGAG